MGKRIRGRAPVVAVFAAASAAAMAVVAPLPAWAHDELASSAPADGAVLAGPPTEVRLEFSQRPDPRLVRVAVTGPGATTVPSERLTVEGTITRMRVRPTAAGQYTLAYRVVSADGHPIQGIVRFTVTSPDPGGRTAPPSARPTTPSMPTATPPVSAPARSAVALPAGTGTGSGGSSGWGAYVVLGAAAAAAAGVGLLLLMRPRRRRAAVADGDG